MSNLMFCHRQIGRQTDNCQSQPIKTYFCPQPNVFFTRSRFRQTALPASPAPRQPGAAESARDGLRRRDMVTLTSVIPNPVAQIYFFQTIKGNVEADLKTSSIVRKNFFYSGFMVHHLYNEPRAKNEKERKGKVRK